MTHLSGKRLAFPRERCVRLSLQMWADHAPQPQTCRAVAATSFSLDHCWSSLSRFPSAVEANPHCGLSARFSRGTYFDASSIRFASTSASSMRGTFELTSPSTTVLPLGTKRNGSKVPERSSSYSSRNRSTSNVPNNFSAIESYPPSAYQWLRLFPRHK